MNIDVIKRIALNAFNASNPVNVLIGTVSKDNPIEIEIHQKLKLTKEFLIMTERVTKYEVDLEHDHGGSSALSAKTPVRTGLKKGDKVVLLRVQGGHQFVVLDKVVE
ncbi:hypothetical protein HMPREF1210_01130 [Paenisporosarcina sp. HGH0030]|uniref:DUF2577 domain-containing protein n=1 Tax=Paenisporosarcina sp. HGH0030 TaxID=1078085 RepID=UPI00034EC97C|nr:DUF2577 domain-containing protein [Paenisporosarcina sp. HGH0030]EPD52750.1 hypothetical protein HMPREF1210_01130 [Paenisporosarcina sp. HGH0030]